MPFSTRSRPYRRLLVADTSAQIYALAKGPPAPASSLSPYSGPLQEVFGCAFGHRGAHKLGDLAHWESSRYGEEGYWGIARVALSGHYAAYEVIANRLGCGFCHWGVAVRDLSSGRVVREVPTGTPTNPALEENYGVGPTTALLLTDSGSVAWITDAHGGEGRPSEGGYQVHAADSHGTSLLASGPDIDPSSLALAGGTVYWMQGGEPRSASVE